MSPSRRNVASTRFSSVEVRSLLEAALADPTRGDALRR
jgi:hypothetical protein